MDDAHAKTWEEVVEYFGTDLEKGLNLDQIKSYQKKYGPNGKSPHFLLLVILFRTVVLVTMHREKPVELHLYSAQSQYLH